MTPNRVTVALEKYTKYIASSNQAALKTMLSTASNSCTDELMYLPVKSPVGTIFLSIFLGGLGIDRFYLGDTRMGVAKLLARILSVTLLSSIPSLSTIASLAVGIWLFADIFVTYKLCKEKNYSLLTDFLSKHQQQRAPNKPRTNNNLNNAMSGVTGAAPTRRRLSDFINEMEAESENNTDSKQELFGNTEPEHNSAPDENAPSLHTTGYNSLNDMDEDRKEDNAPLGSNTSHDDGRRAGEDSSCGRSTSNPFSR